MLLHIPAVLDDATLSALTAVAARSELFIDGAATAGWHARSRKHNQQGNDSALVKGALQKVENVLLQQQMVRAAAQPKHIVKLLLSRYERGMSYGEHVDDAFINGERADLSFTLFVSPPENYDGGALIIDEAAGEREVKLAAGSLFLYPSTSLHRVAEVTSGTRVVIVGWIRSRIRHAHQREVLFDLERAIHTLRQNHGDNEHTLPLLLKTRSNLLRQWAD